MLLIAGLLGLFVSGLLMAISLFAGDKPAMASDDDDHGSLNRPAKARSAEPVAIDSASDARQDVGSAVYGGGSNGAGQTVGNLAKLPKRADSDPDRQFGTEYAKEKALPADDAVLVSKELPEDKAGERDIAAKRHHEQVDATLESLTESMAQSVYPDDRIAPDDFIADRSEGADLDILVVDDFDPDEDLIEIDYVGSEIPKIGIVRVEGGTSVHLGGLEILKIIGSERLGPDHIRLIKQA